MSEDSNVGGPKFGEAMDLPPELRKDNRFPSIFRKEDNLKLWNSPCVRDGMFYSLSALMTVYFVTFGLTSRNMLGFKLGAGCAVPILLIYPLYCKESLRRQKALPKDWVEELEKFQKERSLSKKPAWYETEDDDE